MNAAQLLELIIRSPLEPFEIQMTTGKRIPVVHPTRIATSAKSTSCAVFATDDGPEIIALSDIADLHRSATWRDRHKIACILICWITVICMLPQILYLTGITPTGPVLGFNFIQSVVCAALLAAVTYIWLRARFRG